MTWELSRLVCVMVVMAVLSCLTVAAPVDSADQDSAASGYGGHHERVQIKVYRGPSKGHGYDKFAPWGYWVKQPANDHGKHHHHHDDRY